MENWLNDAERRFELTTVCFRPVPGALIGPKKKAC